MIHICDDWLHAALPNLEHARAAAVSLRRSDEWSEVVGGLASVAVQFDPTRLAPQEAERRFAAQLGDLDVARFEPAAAITLAACYDAVFAPDGDMVSGALGLAATELAEWHTAQRYTVAMLGFLPGFAYLAGDPDTPEIGRLETARVRVETGSIGLTGAQSCLYSIAGPGGWPIIGRVARSLFDTEQTPPALLSAGQPVRFRPVTLSEFERSAC